MLEIRESDAVMWRYVTICKKCINKRGILGDIIPECCLMSLDMFTSDPCPEYKNIKNN